MYTFAKALRSAPPCINLCFWIFRLLQEEHHLWGSDGQEHLGISHPCDGQKQQWSQVLSIPGDDHPLRNDTWKWHNHVANAWYYHWHSSRLGMFFLLSVPWLESFCSLPVHNTSWEVALMKLRAMIVGLRLFCSKCCPSVPWVLTAEILMYTRCSSFPFQWFCLQASIINYFSLSQCHLGTCVW